MRLIDADELKKYSYRTDWNVPVVDVSDIDNAPTVEPKLSEEQIEQITDLLETEWGYKGIREDISRILRGGAE